MMPWTLLAAVLCEFALHAAAAEPTCSLDFALEPPVPPVSPALRVLVRNNNLQSHIARVTALLLRSLLSMQVDEVHSDFSSQSSSGLGTFYDIDPVDEEISVSTDIGQQSVRFTDTTNGCLRGLNGFYTGSWPDDPSTCPSSAVIDLGSEGLETQPGVYASPALQTALSKVPARGWYKVLRMDILQKALPPTGSLVEPLYSLQRRWAPPWCLGSNASNCREIFHLATAGDAGRLEQLVTSYQLPFVVSYIGVKAWQDLLVRWATLPPTLVYAYLPNEIQAFSMEVARQRIQFPTSLSRCGLGAGSPPCDFPLIAPRVFAAPRVWKELPVALLALFHANYSWGGLQEIVGKQRALQAQGENEDEAFRQGACAWLQSKREHFKSALNECVQARHIVDARTFTCHPRDMATTTSTTSAVRDVCPKGMVQSHHHCQCAPGYHLPEFGPNITQVWEWAMGNHTISTLDSIQAFDTPLEGLGCLPCPPGYVCGGGNFPPVKCHWSHTTTRPAASFQSQCVCDYGYGGTEAGHCLPCGLRRYKEQIGNHECFGICPVFATTLAPAAVNRGLCSCIEGHFASMIQPALKCERCPEGAHCSGGLDTEAVMKALWPYSAYKVFLAHPRPLSKKGYHPRHSADPETMDRPGSPVYKPVFSRCQSAALCAGNNTCAPGMRGLLCSTCDKGWGRAQLLGGKCHQCWNSAGTVMGFSILLIFGMIAMVLYFSDRASNNPDLLGTVVFKICVNHIDFMLFFGDGAASEIFSAQHWDSTHDPARHAFIEGTFGFIHQAVYLRHVYGPGSWALYCQISEHAVQLEVFSHLVFADQNWPLDLRVEFVRYVVALFVPFMLLLIIYCMIYPIFRCRRRRRKEELAAKTAKLAILQKLRRAAYLTDPKPTTAVTELNRYLENLKNSTSIFLLWHLLSDTTESLDLELIAAEIHVGDTNSDNQLNRAELAAVCGRLRNLLPLSMLNEALKPYKEMEVVPSQEFFRNIIKTYDRTRKLRCPTLWAVSKDSVPLFLVFTFMAYPTVNKHLVSGILCQDGSFVGMNGFRLRSDLSMMCYEGSHWRFLACGIVGVLAWGLGIPYWVYRMLRSSIKKPNMRQRCSFHLNGFDRAKPGSFAWDVIIYVAKLVLFTAEVVPFRFTRKIIVVAWCSALMMLHGLMEPFDQRRRGILNFLEKLSFTTITISVICFQAVLDVNMRTLFIVMAIGLSLVANVIFFICCIREWWRDLRIVVFERVERVTAQRKREKIQKQQAVEIRENCTGTAASAPSVSSMEGGQQQDPLTAFGILEAKEQGQEYSGPEDVQDTGSEVADEVSERKDSWLVKLAKALAIQCSLVLDRNSLLQVAHGTLRCWHGLRHAYWSLLRSIHRCHRRSQQRGYMIVLSNDHFCFQPQQSRSGRRPSQFDWTDASSRQRGRWFRKGVKLLRRGNNIFGNMKQMEGSWMERRKQQAEKMEVARVVGFALRSILLSNGTRSLPVSYIEYFFRKTHIHCSSNRKRASAGRESAGQVEDVIRSLEELHQSQYEAEEGMDGDDEGLLVQKVLALNLEQHPDTDISFRVADLEIFLMSTQDEALRTMLHDVQAVSWRPAKHTSLHKECSANGKVLSCTSAVAFTEYMSRWGGLGTHGRAWQVWEESTCLKPSDGPAPPPEWIPADSDPWQLPPGLKAFGIIEDLPVHLRDEFAEAICQQQDSFKYSLLDQIPQAVGLLMEARMSMPVLSQAARGDWRRARWLLMQLEPADAQRVFWQLRERLTRDGWECTTPLWVYNVAKRCLHDTALFKTPAGVEVLGREESVLLNADESELVSYRGEVSAGSSIYIDVALVSLDQLKAELFLAHLVRLKLDRFQKLLAAHRDSSASPTWQLLKLHSGLRAKWHPDLRADDVRGLEEILQAISEEEQLEVLASFKWKEEEFMHQTSDWVFGRCYMEMVGAPCFSTKLGTLFYDETYLREQNPEMAARIISPFFGSRQAEVGQIDIDLPLCPEDSEQVAVLKLQEKLFLFLKHQAAFKQHQAQYREDPGRNRAARTVKDAAMDMERLQTELLKSIRSGRYQNFKARLEFSVQLDLTGEQCQEVLEVWIISARDLWVQQESRDTLEIFCTCYLEGKPDSELATKLVENTLSPVWNHRAEMLEYKAGDSLVFTVWDKDIRGELDTLLGRATISAADIEKGVDGEVRLTSQQARGKPQLQVKVKVAPRAADLVPMDDGSLVVSKLRSDGPMAAWNKANEDQQVQVGDRIVEVSGQESVRDTVLACAMTHECSFALVRRDIVEVKLSHLLMERPVDALDILIELELLRKSHRTWILDDKEGQEMKANFARRDPNLTSWLLARILEAEEKDFSLCRTRRGFPYLVLPKIDIVFDTHEGEDVEEKAVQVDTATTVFRKQDFCSQVDLAPTPQTTAAHLARELKEFESAQWDLDRLASLRHQVHGALKQARRRSARYIEQLQQQATAKASGSSPLASPGAQRPKHPKDESE